MTGDPVLTAIAEYGWVAVILYIVVREALSVIRKWWPENVRRTTAREERDAACQQREAEALEKIAGALATNNERLSLIERVQIESMAALAKANESLSVLLDRRLRSRKSDAAAD